MTLAMALRMALDRLTAATIRYSRCSAFALCSIIAGISFSVQATSARTSRRACFYCFEKLRRLAKRDNSVAACTGVKQLNMLTKGACSIAVMLEEGRQSHYNIGKDLNKFDTIPPTGCIGKAAFN